MEEADARKRTPPSRPVLLAAAGPSAVATLGQLPAVARDLRVHVAGPFGVAAVESPSLEPLDGTLRVSHAEWLREIQVSGGLSLARDELCLSDPHDRLVGELTRLVRRLRAGQPALMAVSAPLLRVSAYLVVDLADQFRADNEGENPLHDMASDPTKWAEYVVQELKTPTVGLGDLGYLFALHAVKDWMKSRPLEELIANLGPDPQWFQAFVTRVCAPRWPTPRGEPEVDTAIIAASDALWEIIGPLAEANAEAFPLLRVAWQDPRTLVVVRIVQGLSEGWLNYDPLPSRPRYAAAQAGDDGAD